MARIRTIKPGFFTSPTIGELSLSARLTFIGLWTYCDDAGRGRDDPRLIKAAVWPLDDSHGMRKIEADLGALEKAALVERYTSDGRCYIRIRSWIEHQRINRPSPSLHPPSPEESVRPHHTVTHGSPLEGNKEGNKETGREGNSSSRASETHDPPVSSEELETHRSNGEGPPWKTDPLVERWCQDVTGNHGRAHRIRVFAIVDHFRGYLDAGVIDEAIGRLSKLDSKPASPSYLLTTLQNDAAGMGINVPPLKGAR